jgi:hypothetical protein
MQRLLLQLLHATVELLKSRVVMSHMLLNHTFRYLLIYIYMHLIYTYAHRCSSMLYHCTKVLYICVVCAYMCMYMCESMSCAIRCCACIQQRCALMLHDMTNTLCTLLIQTSHTHTHIHCIYHITVLGVST